MSLAQQAVKERKFDEAEWALSRAVNAATFANDEGAIRAAKLCLSKAWEEKSDATPPGFLKTYALERSIDALKGIKEVRDRRRALHLKLADAQIDVLDDFAVIEHETDITDIVQQTRDTFRPLSLFECLKVFALISIPRTPSILIDEARDMGQRFVLSGLFPIAVIDEQGRTVAKEGHTEIGDASRHTILRNESIHIGLSVRGQIEHAREIIYNDKDLSEAHLIALCNYSPFVPAHAATMVGEGLFAFFQRDYARAGAFMIPYLESCLRHVLERTGEPSTVLKEGGVESNLMLGTMLSKHRSTLEDVLSPEYVFAIENLFDHPLGEKIRHRHAHGMLSKGHYFSQSVIYGLWLMYSLTILPLLSQWNDVETALTEQLSV
jgi:hypothetical protein